MTQRAERLMPDAAGIARAGALLAQGRLVAFPTETVYGLGADARDGDAVAAIYAAKGRPHFNPLIVHVPDIAAAKGISEWSDMADRLARAFWPGPLTLVLPRREGSGIASLVTAGLPTVAIRVPAAKVAQDILRAACVPVAAPSANPSGQISPTRADHVMAGLGERIAAVVDGGPCAVGVESTILGLDPPTILRPGGITGTDLAGVLGGAPTERQAGAPVTAPGQLTAHYAPRARIRLAATVWQAGEARLGFGPVDADLNLSPAGDLAEAAANLFDHLHRLDATGAEVIAISPIPDTGLGQAINDRLARAAADR